MRKKQEKEDVWSKAKFYTIEKENYIIAKKTITKKEGKIYEK